MPNDGILPVRPENLPPYLTQRLVWCVWIEDSQGSPSKLPISPLTRERLSVTTSSGWCRFDQAVMAHRQGLGLGLGVLLRREDNVVGIALDDAIAKDGAIAEWAAAIVASVRAYWERSENGLHGFVRGTLPPGCPNRIEVPDGVIEAYCEYQFLPISGHRIPGSALFGLPACPEELARLIWHFTTTSERSEPPDSPATPNLVPTDGAQIVEADSPAGELDQWPEPERLESELLPVAKFDPVLLPEAFRTYVQDVAERLQVPLDFLGASLLVSFGSVVGRRARVRPKKLDDWEECGNLWGAAAAGPGAMKSPAIRRTHKFLHRLEEEAAQSFADAMAQYEQDLEAYEDRKRAWKQRQPPTAEEDEIQEFGEHRPVKPTLVRFVVNDGTVPKLQVISSENSAGFLLFRDELSATFATLDLKGREADRAYYLEGWSGDQSFVSDRIGRGTTRAPRNCLSLFGGIQPAPLRRYLLDAILGGDNNDGLAQRLQIFVWPDLSEEWVNVDREPDREAEEHVMNIFRSVAIRPPEEFIARFDNEAQEYFNNWRATLEHRLRKEPMPPYLQGHLSKYRGLFPRIAMLCHLADSGFVAEIPALQVRRAAAWCQYLETHAQRMYGEGSPRNIAAGLGDKIRSGALGTRFTFRKIQKKGWAGLTKPNVIRAVLQELQDAGWIRKEPVHTTERGGRPTEVYQVNPKVRT